MLMETNAEESVFDTDFDETHLKFILKTSLSVGIIGGF
jgi:hypothetical protein